MGYTNQYFEQWFNNKGVTQCLALERGGLFQGLGAHLFSFASSVLFDASFPGIIMNSHLFDKCSSSDDIVSDYPSHVSCFSERRGVINESHSIDNVCMGACSSLCVGSKWGREGRGRGLGWKETFSLSLVFLTWLHSISFR